MLNEKGHEIPDPRPVAVPARFLRPPSRFDEMRALLNAARQDALSRQLETPEEADDFDVGEDYDPTSPWELTADQEADPLFAPRGDGGSAPMSTPGSDVAGSEARSSEPGPGQRQNGSDGPAGRSNGQPDDRVRGGGTAHTDAASP